MTATRRPPGRHRAPRRPPRRTARLRWWRRFRRASKPAAFVFGMLAGTAADWALSLLPLARDYGHDPLALVPLVTASYTPPRRIVEPLYASPRVSGPMRALLPAVTATDLPAVA